ncbi:MAG: hypothetical protein LBN43_03625 [Oscillospiraceae bacterium]|nr:hypothetical protein [Oscillospiraceae bacterium]
MEYNNHYIGSTGEVIRTPRKQQGPPSSDDEGADAVYSEPHAEAKRVSGGDSGYGDLMLLAVLLLLWLERKDEDALFTLLALLLI